MEQELLDIVHYKPSPSIIPSDPRLSDKKAVLGWNVCYVVCGLIIDNDKVLMIQEAKPSCAGKWYLPAGRVEKNESLEDAVKREVKEEAGVDFEPQSLILIETQSYNWIRFTFTGCITGGTLKTLADKESLQAKWLPIDEHEMSKRFPIRAYDCFRVIKHSYNWYNSETAVRYNQLTIPSCHTNSCVRIILVHNNNYVLTGNQPNGNTHLPSGPFNNSSLPMCIDNIIKGSGYTGEYELIGVITIEHLVSGGDGVQLTLLINCKDDTLKDNTQYNWTLINNHFIIEHFNLCLQHKYMTVQMSF